MPAIRGRAATVGEMHKSPHLRTGRQVHPPRTHTHEPTLPLSKPDTLMNEAYSDNGLATHTHTHTRAILNLACLSLIYFIRNHQVSKSRLLICSPVLDLNAVDKVINPPDNDLC